jgi:hypothetical protein
VLWLRPLAVRQKTLEVIKNIAGSGVLLRRDGKRSPKRKTSVEEDSRCGDDVRMQARVRGPGSRSDADVEFVVKHTHGQEAIESRNSRTDGHRAEATWTSKKLCVRWGGPDAFFTARAGGDHRDSEGLSFHQYADFERETFRVGGPQPGDVNIEFQGGEFIILD